jgi:hypothetical protein
MLRELFLIMIAPLTKKNDYNTIWNILILSECFECRWTIFSHYQKKMDIYYTIWNN